MITLYQFLRIVEIRTKIISVSGLALGIAYALYRSATINVFPTILFSVSVLLIDMATTGFNSFFDYYKGVDHKRLNRERDKVIVHDGVAPGIALVVSLGLYGLAIILGIVVSVLTSFWIIPIGALSMSVGFLYTGGPVPISRTPFGELFAGGFLGWVLVTLTVFVASSGFEISQDVLPGIPSFFFVASILTVNNTCDIEGDTSAGRRTLSIVLGRRGGEILSYLLGASAYLSAAVLTGGGVFPRSLLFGLVPAVLISLPSYWTMHTRGFSHATKRESMQRISGAFLLFSCGMILPLLIGSITG